MKYGRKLESMRGLNKYKNVKFKTPEGTFDSKGEYLRWRHLKNLENSGEIEYLSRQARFELIPKQVIEGHRSFMKVEYVADFIYTRDGQLVVEDYKSSITEKDPVFIIKRKLMYQVHGIYVEVVKKWNQ